MTPPRETGIGSTAETPGHSPAVSSCVQPSFQILQNRSDYLRAASARRQGAGSFLLQARDRGDDSALIRLGFTASKKIGNAVARNRAKRRLRALARQVMPELAKAGWDYVLVARPEATIARVYADLVTDLQSAMAAIHKGRK